MPSLDFTRQSFVLLPANAKYEHKVQLRGTTKVIGKVWEADGKGFGWYFRLNNRDHRQGDRSKGYSMPFKTRKAAIMAMGLAYFGKGGTCAL